MVLQYLRPSEIRFTQDSIAGRFQDGGFLNNAIYNIQKGVLSPEDFPHINVVSKNGKLYSFDNRRLYIFRVCEFEGIIDKIPVQRVESWRLREDRFTTENDGVTLYVRQGGTKRHYRKPWLQELDDRGNRNLPPSTSNYVVNNNQSPTTFGNTEYLQSHNTGYTNHDYIPYPEVKTSTNAPTAQSSNLNARTNTHSDMAVPDTYTTRKISSRSSSLRSQLSKIPPKPVTSGPVITPAPKAREITAPATRTVTESVDGFEEKKKSRLRRFFECLCCCRVQE
uniref:uncharacterized protein LOC120347692 n=1 Tax=Styela clava TaxID=7725 RepID=UPI001939DCBB|nr:uncharacterized protein LOC120347692 [Styela clava]